MTFSPELLTLVILLVGLVAVLKARTVLTVEGKADYNAIVWGLVTMALSNLIKIYGDSGKLAFVPFLSEPLFLQLFFWITTITGLTLIVSGITRWLPISREHRRFNQFRFRKLEVVKKAVQLLGVESRLTVVLDKILKDVVEQYSLEGGAVYLASSSGQVKCEAVTEGMPERANQMTIDWERIKKFGLTSATSLRDAVRVQSKETPAPDTVVPIGPTDSPVGLVLLWSKQREHLCDEDHMNLKIIADLVASKIANDRIKIRDSFHGQRRLWIEKSTEQLDFGDNLESNLSRVFEALSPVTRTDFLSLSFVHEDHQTQRILLAEQQRSLNEFGLDFYNSPTIAGYVLNHGLPLIINDLDAAARMPMEQVITATGRLSVAAFPVKCGLRIEGVLTLASRLKGAFGQRQVAYIRSITPHVAALIKEEKHRYEVKKHQRRRAILHGYFTQIGALVGEQQRFEHTIDVVCKELRPTLTRLSIFDEESALLFSKVLTTSRALENIPTADGILMLSSMPYHRLAIDNGKVIFINNESSHHRMDELEQQLTCGSLLRTALIVPVVVKNKVLAVITLAETRASRRFRFSQDDIGFVNSVAAALGVSLAGSVGKESLPQAGLAPGIQMAHRNEAARMRSRLKSSLTGIMGSVELLRQDQPYDPVHVEKYLTIIDNSARKINQCLAEASPRQ